MGRHSQYFNRNISDLWDLIDEYKKRGGTNPEALNEKSPVKEETIREIKSELKKDRKNERYIYLKVAGYYYGRLHFKEAEETYWRGLRTQRIDYRDNADDYYFHEGLRGLYMLQGRYSEALHENEWIVKNTEDKKAAYYQDRVNLSLFLKKAEEDMLNPKKIKYGFEINRDCIVSIKK